MHRPAQRIVSLLPSATEIVCALGAGDSLVGISHECDHPDGIRDRPILTRPRIDTRGPSGAIDAAVRAAVRDALSLYAVDVDRLGALAPRSEEHTSELQSIRQLVCRLLLEKQKRY